MQQSTRAGRRHTERRRPTMPETKESGNTCTGADVMAAAGRYDARNGFEKRGPEVFGKREYWKSYAKAYDAEVKSRDTTH